jgi:hypothetical protein
MARHRNRLLPSSSLLPAFDRMAARKPGQEKAWGRAQELREENNLFTRSRNLRVVHDGDIPS